MSILSKLFERPKHIEETKSSTCEARPISHTNHRDIFNGFEREQEFLENEELDREDNEEF